MKKLFTLIFCLVSAVGRGQSYCANYNFDGDTCYKHYLLIDTVNYHHNLWQIGRPHKANLNSAYSAPNVIITDTLNPYPANDTSVFILKMPALLPDHPGGSWYGSFGYMYFYYRMDINSGDKATVEISTDSGSHWFNVQDTLLPGFYWGTTGFWGSAPPRFDTSTNFWLPFYLNVGMGSISVSDTTLFRFTFISDSTVSGRGGWMMDYFYSQYWWESVPLLQNSNLITLYPNPSHGNIFIHTDKPHKGANITVHNIQGQQVYSGAAPGNGYLNLQLPSGIYTLRYSDEEEYCVKQIVIQN